MANDNKREIISQMGAGLWEEALPKSIWSPLDAWFKRHKGAVVVRIVIFDIEANFKFACHFRCASGGGAVSRVYLPMENAKPATALGVPAELYDLPIYCLPDDTLARASIKKGKSKSKKAKE